MRWSLRLAKFGETEVRIHITFLLLLLWIAVAYYARGGMHAAVQGVVFIIALFACVVLHEFGHVLAARTYGISTPDITLLPIGGVARLQRMPDEPGQELVVALAGPAVNVVIALGLFLGLRGAARLYDPAQLDSPTIGLLAKLLSVNVWLVLFNLIPAFPMDGGRVFRALLAMRMSYARATRIAAAAGQAIAFAFAFIGLFYNPLLIFIALFIYLGASQEAAFAEMKEAARGLPVADVMMTEFRTLPLTATLNDAVEALLRTSQHEFPIVDEQSQTVGLLTRDEMIGALRERGPDTPVSEVMRRDVPIIQASRGFEEAFRFINESQSPAILVTDGAGKVVGMLTAENVGELMMVKSAMGGNGKSKPRGAGPSHLPPAVAAT
jgi:Zn-dependent protease/predicted transcriptional regulator